MKIYNVNSLLKTEDSQGVISAYPKHTCFYRRNSEEFELRELMSNSNITTQQATDVENQAGAAYADGDALMTALDSFLGI